jgi:hypothetical protein
MQDEMVPWSAARSAWCDRARPVSPGDIAVTAVDLSLRGLLQIDGTRLLWQQSESLSLGKVACCDDLEVAPVEGGDLVQVEPLGE